jgi:kynurenine formamidase
MCAPSIIALALADMNRRDAAHFTAGLMAGAVMCGANGAGGWLASPPPARRTFSADHIVDLTHTLSATFPIYPGPDNLPFQLTNLATIARDDYYANKWELVEHHGTHLDAPGHFTANGVLADKLEPASLIVPAVVIDITERARQNHDAVIVPDDLLAWERLHGRLPKNCAIFLNAGWDAKAGDSKEFLGLDHSQTLHSPGYSREACEFLLHERDVVGLATDTLTIDIGPSKDFTVHKLWLGAGKWALECVANLSQIPPAGATVFIGAPKVANASGGPTRVLACW